MKEQKKRTYKAPKLTVVPLKPEERLLLCGKTDPTVAACDLGGLQLS